ncbi:MAG: DUF4124 domain-containing protein [Francisellaceae bacterium]
MTIFLIFFISPLFAQIYSWQDSNGNTVFCDHPDCAIEAKKPSALNSKPGSVSSRKPLKTTDTKTYSQISYRLKSSNHSIQNPQESSTLKLQILTPESPAYIHNHNSYINITTDPILTEADTIETYINHKKSRLFFKNDKTWISRPNPGKNTLIIKGYRENGQPFESSEVIIYVFN